MGRLESVLARLRWTILVVALGACQKSQPPLLPDAYVPEPRLVVPSSDSVAIPPRGSHPVGFHLLGANSIPVPGAVMSFTILDAPQSPGSGGARLSLSSGLTDEQGWVTLQVIAGSGSEDAKPLSFWIRASAGDVFRELPVFVTSGVLASAEIVPQVDGKDPVASFSITFYDNTVCADLSRDHSKPRPVRTFSPSPDKQSELFSSVVTSGFHAVLGVALGAQNNVVAKGCVDLPGSSLTASQTMRVYLPLTSMRVSPVGTYRVEAQFSPPAQQPGILSVRDQWQILSAQPCDPASIWLDCTIDALSGNSADDPLDCQPVAGGEGTLGDILSAKRSLAGSGDECTDQVDASGKVSLDTKTYALFTTTFLRPLKLAKLPEELSATLSLLSVQSTLTVAESGLDNVLAINHALDTLTLPNALKSIHVPAANLGLPVRDVWFASPQSDTGQLELVSHGFTLHLGSLARLVFSQTSLTSRMGLADPGAFVSALFSGAGRTTRSTMLLGCEALDSLLCEEADRERGCILPACQAGLEKLAQRLDSSFSILDGPGLDFFLSGTAPLVDGGNGQADTLGGFMRATFSAPVQTSADDMWSAERVSSASQ